MIGGSSGYDSAHSIFSEYILFSYGVCNNKNRNRNGNGHNKKVVISTSFSMSCKLLILVSTYFFFRQNCTTFAILTRGGPMIMPVQWVRVMSSSFSRPHEIVPSLTPFWPCSNSSRRRKFRGTTAKKAHRYSQRGRRRRKTIQLAFIFHFSILSVNCIL